MTDAELLILGRMAAGMIERHQNGIHSCVARGEGQNCCIDMLDQHFWHWRGIPVESADGP